MVAERGTKNGSSSAGNEGYSMDGGSEKGSITRGKRFDVKTIDLKSRQTSFHILGAAVKCTLFSFFKFFNEER